MSRKYIIFMVITFVVSLIATVLSLREAVYYQKIVDECFEANGTIQTLIKYMSIVIALGLGGFALGIVGAISDNNFTQRFTTRMRKEVFDKVQTLSVGYVTNASPGDIMNRAFNDTNQIQTFMRLVTINLLKAVFLFVVATVMLLQMNWKLAIITMLPAPFALWIQQWFWNKFMKRLFKSLRIASDEQNSYLHDAISGIKVVKVFGTEARVAKQFSRHAKKVAQLNVKTHTISEWVSPLSSIILYIGQWLNILLWM